MALEMKDPLARMIGMEVAEVREHGIVTTAQINPEFCNPYGFAHGGYVYTLGHITAVLSAELCEHRSCVVVDAACQYLSSLKASPARVETELQHSGKELLVYRVKILDALNHVCFNQTVTLKEVDDTPCDFHAQPLTIFAERTGETDPVTGIAYPKVSPFFAKCCHIHMIGRGENGLIYGADLYPETVDCYGAAHGGMMYTMCDACAGGSVAMLLGRRPVTVAGHISYLRSAMVGPVRGEAKLVRGGKQLMYYDIDLTDGTGALVAAAQFTMQGVEYQTTENFGKEYRNKAFKD